MRKRLVGALAGLMLTVTAACGGAASSGGGTNSSAVFQWAYSVAPTSLDPHLGTSEYDLLYLFPVYDTLVYVNADGETEPMLAKEWNLSEDGKTFTMSLRRGVTFSDGARFDADAVQANLERVLEDPRSSIAAQLSGVVKKVSVVDPLTVELDLKGPGGALPGILGSRAGMMVSPRAFDNPDLDQRPVGTGAFTLETSTPGASYTYERRTDYWDEKAYEFQGMEIVIQGDDNTRLNSVRSGELSATFIRADQVAEAESAGLEVTQGPRMSFYSLEVNSDRSEFDDKKVRQALSKAINREEINQGLNAGGCTPEVQPFPEGHYAHADGVPTDEWSYDPEGAKQLLADAGLPNGFTFQALVPNISGYEELAQVLQAQFNEIGVTMDLQVVDAAQSTTRFVEGAADAVVGSFGGASDPSVYTSATFTSEGSSNPGGLTTPQIEKLQLKAQESLDTEERADVYDKLLDAVFELGPTDLIVCSRRGDLVSAEGVNGLEVYLTGTYGFRDVTISQ